MRIFYRGPGGLDKRTFRDPEFSRRYLWNLLSGNRSGCACDLAVDSVFGHRKNHAGKARRETEIRLLGMGRDGLYLRSCGGHFILFLLRMDLLRSGTSHLRAWLHTGLGVHLSALPLGTDTLGLLRYACSMLRVHATCARRQKTEIFRGMPLSLRRKDG